MESIEHSRIVRHQNENIICSVEKIIRSSTQAQHLFVVWNKLSICSYQEEKEGTVTNTGAYQNDKDRMKTRQADHMF